jgi:hypothetical protein
MSFANITLYGSVLPSYGGKKDKDKDDVIRADDPKNKGAIRNLLFG